MFTETTIINQIDTMRWYAGKFASRRKTTNFRLSQKKAKRVSQFVPHTYQRAVLCNQILWITNFVFLTETKTGSFERVFELFSILFSYIIINGSVRYGHSHMSCVSWHILLLSLFFRALALLLHAQVSFVDDYLQTAHNLFSIHFNIVCLLACFGFCLFSHKYFSQSLITMNSNCDPVRVKLTCQPYLCTRAKNASIWHFIAVSIYLNRLLLFLLFTFYSCGIFNSN